MIEVVCSCGRTLRTADGNAGKTGRCPACEGPVTFPMPAPEPEPVAIPAASAGGDGDDEEIVFPPVDGDDGPWWAPETFDPPEIPPGPEKHHPSRDHEAPGSAVSSAGTIPAEPWCYEILTTFASIMIWLAIGQFGVVLVVGLNTPGGPSLAIVAYSFGSLVGVCFAAAPIFLVVDIARNIRAIRYGSRDTR